MGRPPRPKDVKQGERIMVTFTESERRDLEGAADGEPLGTYVRRLVLRHLARRKK